MNTRYLHGLGVGLSVVGVAYVTSRLMGQADQLVLSDIPTNAWWAAWILALLYAAANCFLARAWWALLCHHCVALSWADAVRIYGLSQLAKYVPGNLFHLVGRQALGLAQGISGRALVQTAGWEMVSLLVGACLFAAWWFPLIWPTWHAAFAAILFVAGIATLGLMAHRLGSPSLARAFAWHVVFLGSSGGLFVTMFMVLTEQPVPLAAVPGLGAAYVLAWLLGLVTPGAPAGLGTREAALVLLLERTPYAPTGLLLAVLGMRCITVAGDLIFFVLAGRWLLCGGPDRR